MTDAQVGFAGLGAMGRGMARNLHKAGLLRAVWNRTTARADELAAELGVAAATDPAALARECDVIVLCVSADADVLAVVDALLPGLAARRTRHRLLDRQRRHGARGGAPACARAASSSSTRR